MNTKGRTKGSTNKLTTQVKTTLFDSLKDYYNHFDKTFTMTSPNDRFGLLLKALQFLLPKNGTMTNEQRELSNVITEKLKPHFSKLDTYISLCDANKRPEILIRLLKHLSPEQQEIIVKTISSKNQP